jgi:hypothetical protein
MLWFVRLRSVKLGVCRWTAKILASNGKIDNRLGVEHPHMRIAFRTAASLFAGGFFLMSSFGVSAQTQGSGPPVAQEEQKQGEAKPPEGQPAADEATAEEQAAARAQAEIEEYRQAAARLSLTSGSAECVWTGRRIASLLWRDDMDTALRYIGLYDRFGCSAEHLKLSFRCMVRQGPLDPKAADGLAARVHACWLDPDGPTTSASKATEEPAQKNGTIPN